MIKMGKNTVHQLFIKLSNDIKSAKVLSESEYRLKKLVDYNIFYKWNMSCDSVNYNGSWESPKDCSADIRKNNRGEYDALVGLFKKADYDHSSSLHFAECHSVMSDMGYVIRKEKFEVFWKKL
eukprot:CAMPEP_0116913876 /NCGR_PEP_ID=MMETSP0467-20121206/16968_1 /TAXON_ID=283647 /ORGANISM="Mesodinium pulex, Strain SPMC105" /LENGTH=122 /DNA_ID=CAMNT_0004590181 /DNA_START=715 /DNA_END=1083 /DNA_ORIENTATION=+